MQTELQVGVNLKRIRKEKGLSLDKTAKVTGVSKAMLGQIERGESSPTVAKLWQIASGLNVSFSHFISPISDNELTDPLPSQDKALTEGLLVKVLFPFEKDVGFEMFELGLEENFEHVSKPHNFGVIEHVICISGKIALFFDDNWHELTIGQALRFNAAQPHRYKNMGKGTAFFHNIIHYPSDPLS
ncbi:transcriptional regulator with XRE-family HTH domain [Providencia alcalifaciens]|nr:transcriptional regulator with XRE-family HTH domain [Providencia alcalifaciens]